MNGVFVELKVNFNVVELRVLQVGACLGGKFVFEE